MLKEDEVYQYLQNVNRTLSGGFLTPEAYRLLRQGVDIIEKLLATSQTTNKVEIDDEHHY